MRKVYFILLFVILTFSATAQFSISGKLRTLKPMILTVKDFNDKVIVQCDIKSSQEFSTKKLDIVPDLYTLTIGEWSDMVILTNIPVTIKGYLDDKNPQTTKMLFEGISLDPQCKAFAHKFNQTNKNDVSFLLNSKDVNPLFIATTIYKYRHLIEVYEQWKALSEMMPKDSKALICDFVRKGAIEREVYRIGGQAYDFKVENKDGKMVSLSDFKGKYVLIDFWASWCGPCRREMQNIKKIFKELGGDKVQFISISLDDTKEIWQKAESEEQIPWVSLWDKDGFKKTILQSKFGFSTIPFIVFIDKEGKTVARYIRGEEIRTMVKKIIDNKL